VKPIRLFSILEKAAHLEDRGIVPWTQKVIEEKSQMLRALAQQGYLEVDRRSGKNRYHITHWGWTRFIGVEVEPFPSDRGDRTSKTRLERGGRSRTRKEED